MAEAMARLIIADLRGGRNGTDPPLSLKQPLPQYQGGAASGAGECVEAFNVDWYHATLARKRGGATLVDMTFDTLPTFGTQGPHPFTGVIGWMGRHVPGVDETASQLWAADNASPPVVAASGISPGLWWATPLVDNLTPADSYNTDLTGASIHGKFFLSYKSAVNRLHCYDPAVTTATANPIVRRTGMSPGGSAPTCVDAGAGAYAAVLRYYRVRFIEQVGTAVTRRSEPTASVAFTPSGANGVARVTRPTAVGEGETAWELEASLDNVTFFLLTTVAIATTTFDDNAATTQYAAGTVSAATGTYTLQKSYKYLAVDQNRVLGFGSWTTTDAQNRVEFSAVFGSTTGGYDEERVPLLNYVDLDETDSGAATGLVGPVLGSFYAFKYRQVWKLTPTGVAAQPYSVFPISKVIGAVNHHTIKVGEDANGNPAVYFLSVRGPYRLGAAGLEYIGKPVEDLWLGPTLTVNLTYAMHGVYHSDKRQMWWWYATGLATDAGFVADPSTKIVYDVSTGAWSRHTGLSANARCSVMYAQAIAVPVPLTPAATKNLTPYVGYASTASTILNCDSATATTDNGTAFQAYVTTKPYALGGLGQYCTVGQGTLIAKAAVGVTITQTLIRDLGAETRNASVSLTPQATETRVQRVIDAGAMTGAWAVQVQIGDAAAIASAWTLDAVTLQYVKDQAIA